MTSLAALILADAEPASFAGLDLTERAALTLARAGIADIHVAGTVLSREAQERLHKRGLAVTCTSRGDQPLLSAPDADVLVVISSRTIVEAAAVRTFVRDLALDPGEAALVIERRPDSAPRSVRTIEGGISTFTASGNCTSLHLAALSREAVKYVRTAPNFRQAMHVLGAADCLTAASVEPRFCTRLRDGDNWRRIEREYFYRTNGGSGEGIFTRSIRQFSIPLSQLLVGTPITANYVTMTGLVLSILAGLSFAGGSYWSGVVGATLYFASMILDCSDGEVARAKFGDSKFGAWLETAADYASYFLVLGGIVWGDFKLEGFCKHAISALIGVSGTVVLVFTIGYLRARIASANPGAFDDALAADLKQGTSVQRFAAWGRQFIKRSFLAHLFLFNAVIGQVPALTELWAIGAVSGVILVAAVQAHLIRRVHVEPLQPSLSLSYTEN
jgi:phosphatidylglycerophosphate synthase